MESTTYDVQSSDANTTVAVAAGNASDTFTLDLVSVPS